MNYDDYRESDLMKKDDDQQVDWDETVSAWGGKSLSEIGVDKSKQFRRFFITTTPAAVMSISI